MIHSAVIRLEGKTFNRLTVISYVRKSKWLCACICGKTTVALASSLKNGNTRSCGCLYREVWAKIGKQSANSGRRKMAGGAVSRTPEYSSWGAMIQRCTNPNYPKYRLWGGRGIKVCERWTKFSNFFADMGNRPPNTSLDRYPNNDGNYEPGNCRWATPTQQAGNRRPRRASAVITMEKKDEVIHG